jgi:predicted nucleic acid-binding protein
MVRFWDSSAIAAVLIEAQRTAELLELIRMERQIHVWWATEVECVSAITQFERGRGPADLVALAFRRLAESAQHWIEVVPGPSVREAAKRFLRLHPLRAADALQLAAAWSIVEGNPAGVEFVSLDQRLRDAASREGFPVLPASLRA